MHDDLTSLMEQVSYHAVTRYAQRILGVPVLAVDGTIGSKRCAEIHAAAAALTIDEIRTLILTPTVVAGIRVGATRVASPPMVAWIKWQDGRSVVSTVLATRSAALRQTPSADGRGRARVRRHDHQIIDEADL